MWINLPLLKSLVTYVVVYIALLYSFRGARFKIPTKFLLFCLYFSTIYCSSVNHINLFYVKCLDYLLNLNTVHSDCSGMSGFSCPWCCYTRFYQCLYLIIVLLLNLFCEVSMDTFTTFRDCTKYGHGWHKEHIEHKASIKSKKKTKRSQWVQFLCNSLRYVS